MISGMFDCRKYELSLSTDARVWYEEDCRRFKKSIATPDRCNGTGNGVKMARTPFRLRFNERTTVETTPQQLERRCNAVPTVQLILQRRSNYSAHFARVYRSLLVKYPLDTILSLGLHESSLEYDRLPRILLKLGHSWALSKL